MTTHPSDADSTRRAREEKHERAERLFRIAVGLPPASHRSAGDPASASTGRARRSTPGSRLLRSDEYRDALLPAYYAVLNEQEDAADFRRSLAELHARLRLHEHEPRNESSAEFWARHYEGKRPSLAYPWKSPQDAWIPAEARHAVESFAAERKLPHGSARDVAYSLRFTAEGEAPRLVRWIRTDVGSGDYVLVTASAPESIHYTIHDDPAEARAQARQRAEAVYDEMVRQMEEAERGWRETGRRPLHPQHRSEEARRTAALRLFRRAVLRWKWQRIARAEYVPADEAPPGEGEPVPDSAVRESVNRWASMLGVPLPREDDSRQPRF